MTQPATPFRKDHTGNGSTGPFLYDWKIDNKTQLKVIKQVIATGIETTLTVDTDYTVTGIGNPLGGNINTTSALPATEKITILPNFPYEQDTDFTNQNSVKPEEAESMADKLSRQIKQIVEKLNRAVTLPETSTDSPINYISTMNTIYDDTLTAKNAAEAARDDILNDAGFIVVSADLLGADTIGIVAGDIANVNTVAGSIANVNLTAGSITNVNTVAGDISNVNTVATNISAVNNASTNMAAIIAAPTQAANAAASASQAETFKNQAQAYAENMAFRDTVFLTNADSPYTFTQADTGKMFSIDTSGGAFIGHLPEISGLTLPFVVAVKKATGDSNTVTINAFDGGDGTNTINDNSTTGKVISSVGGSQFLPDTDTTPDRWTTVDFGASAAEEKRQIFEAGTDFTAGSSTTLTLTNAPIAGSSSGLDITFDGVYQHSSKWSYVPGTGVITFDAAIPLGVAEVEARWRTSLPVGTPADGTVGWKKLASGIIASVAEMVSGTANKLISAANFKDYMDSTPQIRARVNFSLSGGSVTIRAQHGIASVVRNSTGKATITLSNAAPNANYNVQVTAGNNATLSGVFTGSTREWEVTRTTTTFGIAVLNNGTFNDLSEINVEVIY